MDAVLSRLSTLTNALERFVGADSYKTFALNLFANMPVSMSIPAGSGGILIAPPAGGNLGDLTVNAGGLSITGFSATDTTPSFRPIPAGIVELTFVSTSNLVIEVYTISIQQAAAFAAKF